MGGAILARYLGNSGARPSGASLGTSGFQASAASVTPVLAAAVCISAPLDVEASCSWMETTVPGRFSSFVLATVTKLAVLFNRQTVASLVEYGVTLGPVLRATTLREIDEHVVCHLNGYDNADHYYKENNPRYFLKDITVPSLFLHALDDPVCPASTLPLDEIRSNPSLTLVTTNQGGHLGWTSGPFHFWHTWADLLACQFLKSQLYKPVVCVDNARCTSSIAAVQQTDSKSGKNEGRLQETLLHVSLAQPGLVSAL